MAVCRKCGGSQQLLESNDGVVCGPCRMKANAPMTRGQLAALWKISHILIACTNKELQCFGQEIDALAIKEARKIELNYGDFDPEEVMSTPRPEDWILLTS